MADENKTLEIKDDEETETQDEKIERNTGA